MIYRAITIKYNHRQERLVTGEKTPNSIFPSQVEIDSITFDDGDTELFSVARPAHFDVLLTTGSILEIPYRLVESALRIPKE